MTSANSSVLLENTRFSRDRPRFNDTLDVIKFVCKDLWTLVFRKQVDNLKTNHRGVYVLTDNAFRPFSRMSTEAGGQAVLRAQPVRENKLKRHFFLSLYSLETDAGGIWAGSGNI